MKRKVVEILYSSKVYADLCDFKVRLACGHFKWLWSFRGDPTGSLQICVYCGKVNVLKVLK